MKMSASNDQSKYNHSIPVPRSFKIASKIFTEVANGGSLNDLIYSMKNQRNIRSVYAMVCNARRNNSLLDEILLKSGLKNEKMNEALAKILVAELLWGKQNLPGDSKPIQVTLSYKSKLEAAAKASSISASLDRVFKPRYARINSIVTTMESTIKCLEAEEWMLLETPETYEEYLKHVTNLNDYEFMKDFHFDDLLVFHPSAQLFDNYMVESGSLILQDKASCLPARLLNPPPGSTVLDMCAAPGVKTAHIANLMENKGTVYAVDWDSKRFNLMNSLIDKYCGKNNCVKTLLQDSMILTGEECPGVKYILLDPSCSGTGMAKRIEDRDDLTANVTPTRLKYLASFQVKLLVQALTEFPDVERVVYSTCSLLEEENEQVISEALSIVSNFHVVPPAVKNWERRRNNDQYDFGHHCLFADFEHDLTNGFFVAVLERKNKRIGKKNSTTEAKGEWQIIERKQSKRKSNDSCMYGEATDESMEVVPEVPGKKKNKKKMKK